MKHFAVVAPIVMAALVGIAPLAHADDDGGAAALGFILGAVAAAPAYAYGPAPRYVYEAPPQIVVRGSGPGYYYSAPPRGYYYRFRDHDRWHHGWHDGWRHGRHDGYRHRGWHRDDD